MKRARIIGGFSRLGAGFWKRFGIPLVAVLSLGAAEPATRPVENHDESKVIQFTLPEALKLDDGTPVTDAATWYAKRRPEILSEFESQVYGKAPARPANESWEVLETGPAFGGKAIRKQIAIYPTGDKK